MASQQTNSGNVRDQLGLPVLEASSLRFQIFGCKYVCVCVCVCVCVYGCMYVMYVRTCTYLCMYACMYALHVCMHVCMYAYYRICLDFKFGPRNRGSFVRSESSLKKTKEHTEHN